MRQCLDPLQAVRRVGPDQPWCVTLPACYPTIIPCTSVHVDDPCVDARHSSPHAALPLIQRLRGRVERHQTPTSSDARHILHRLTRIVQQHVLEFVLHESAFDDANSEINQDRRSLSSSVPSGIGQDRSSTPSRPQSNQQEHGSTVLSIPVPSMSTASHRSEQGSVSSRMLPVSCVVPQRNGLFL